MEKSLPPGSAVPFSCSPQFTPGYSFSFPSWSLTSFKRTSLRGFRWALCWWFGNSTKEHFPWQSPTTYCLIGRVIVVERVALWTNNKLLKTILVKTKIFLQQVQTWWKWCCKNTSHGIRSDKTEKNAWKNLARFLFHGQQCYSRSTSNKYKGAASWWECSCWMIQYRSPWLRKSLIHPGHPKRFLLINHPIPLDLHHVITVHDINYPHHLFPQWTCE